MITLKDRINKEYIEAFKAKEEGKTKKNLLSLVKGTIQNDEGRGKEATDENVLKVLKSIRKGLVENVDRNVDGAQEELDIIETYFPELMSEDEIRKIVTEMSTNGIDNVNLVMKEFNINYKGKADNKIVREVALEIMK